MKAVARTSAAAVLTAIFLVWALAGCGASTRHKVINATAASTDVAFAALLKYDTAHQADIAKIATSREDGIAKLDAWEATYTKAILTATVVYQAIAAAQRLDDDPSVNTMVQAAVTFATMLKELGVTP